MTLLAKRIDMDIGGIMPKLKMPLKGGKNLSVGKMNLLIKIIY